MSRGTRLGCCLGIALALAPLSLALGEDIVLSAQAELVADEDDEGEAVLVRGRAQGAPEGLVVSVFLSLGRSGRGRQVRYGQVHEGGFEVRFGPASKVLAGRYGLLLEVDPDVQARAVAEELGERSASPLRLAWSNGDRAAARAEKRRVQHKLADLLEGLQLAHNNLIMWGEAMLGESAALRRAHPEGIPEPARARVQRSWSQFTRDIFEVIVPTIRHDLREYREYVLLSYYPEVIEIFSQILASLARCHGSFQVGIYQNLGLPVDSDTRARGAFPLREFKRSLPTLARRAYRLLGLKPRDWSRLDVANPELPRDLEGDVFRSSVTNFELRRPGPEWLFDLAPAQPQMRLRLTRRGQRGVVLGVVLRDFPMAASHEDLLRLDEAWVRNNYTNFQLVKAERLRVADERFPGGQRPGSDTVFTVRNDGSEQVYRVRRRSLCSVDHRRTYNLLCFAPEGDHERWSEDFARAVESFRVLDGDAPAGEEVGR
ncbi:MAG: hypothetical protein D6731_24855 [Planctomycetota bacterium]|nr:MAG: hypothetical protein D6731_24855 [Planctomycetota bacterium]